MDNKKKPAPMPNSKKTGGITPKDKDAMTRSDKKTGLLEPADFNGGRDAPQGDQKGYEGAE